MGGVCYVLNTASAATYVLCCAAQAIPHALCGVLCCTVQAAHIPCPDSAIHELIDLMDYGRNGVISWDEFSTFMTHEYNAGKKVREGEYMLPSGKQGGGTRRAEAAGGAGGCKENAGRQNDVHTHTDTDTHKHAHAHAHVLAHTPACCRAAGQREARTGDQRRTGARSSRSLAACGFLCPEAGRVACREGDCAKPKGATLSLAESARRLGRRS